MPFTKGHTPANKRVLTDSVPQTADEFVQANREAEERPTPPGQDNFNEFVHEMRADGIKDAGIPEQIFMGATVDSRPVMTRSGVRERFPSGMGIGYIPDHILKEHGVNLDTEVPRMVQMNGYGNMDENFLDDWMANQFGSGRVCTSSKTGKEYRLKGEVLCTIPKESQDSIDDEFNEIARRFDLGQVQDIGDGPFDIEELSQQEVEKRRQQAIEVLGDLLKGSTTHGTSLEDAVMRIPKAEQERIEHEYRWKDRIVRDQGAPLTRASASADTGSAGGAASRERDNHMDRATETLKNAQRGRGGSYTMGAGFDKDGRVVRS